HQKGDGEGRQSEERCLFRLTRKQGDGNVAHPVGIQSVIEPLRGIAYRRCRDCPLQDASRDRVGGACGHLVADQLVFCGFHPSPCSVGRTRIQYNERNAKLIARGVNEPCLWLSARSLTATAADDHPEPVRSPPRERRQNPQRRGKNIHFFATKYLSFSLM